MYYKNGKVQIINTIDNIIDNCKNISNDYQIKHNEVKKLSNNYKKAIIFIKYLMYNYRNQTKDILKSIKNTKIIPNKDLNKMKLSQKNIYKSNKLYLK